MMRNTLKIVIFLVLFLITAISDAALENRYDYHISNYKARFELLKNSPDVLVTLDITYQIGNQPKSDGFKFVGNNKIVGLRCTDGSGENLRTETLSLRETKIVWHFSPVKNGIQRVFVNFRIRDLLAHRRQKRILNADWVGVFRVPVRKAVYEVIFPVKYQPGQLVVKPGSWTKNFHDGRYQIRMIQTPLTQKKLYVEYME